jgi:GNAT superfamily N-acetyltransferase
MAPDYRVTDRIDPDWLAEQYRRSPVLNAFTVFDRAEFPERIGFRVLERDGAPVAYLLLWNGADGSRAVHWIGSTEAPERLTAAFPDPPLIAAVPDAVAAEVRRRFPEARAQGVQLQVCERRTETAGGVRRLRPEDEPALREFAERVDEPLARGYRGHRFDKGYLVGVFEGSRLLSVASAMVRLPEVWMIGGVVTRPEARGRGHARNTTAWLVREALGAGAVPSLYVLDDNRSARSVYDRLGFRSIDHRTRIELGPPGFA